MKIGILTLPLHTNYGGILQAYALQTVLERMGHEVVVIDVDRTAKLKWYKAPFTICKRILEKMRGGKVPVFMERELNRKRRLLNINTSKFVEKHIHVFKVPSYHSIKEDEFDVIVVGSDQIWRPKYLRCFLPQKQIDMAFLSFTEDWNIKRIAYAASFGTDKLEYNAEEVKRCASLLKRFDRIGVREQSAVRLCHEEFDVKATAVLDPTLLLKPKDYIRLIEGWTEDLFDKKRLMVYVLDESESLNQLINIISQTKGLKPTYSNAKVDNENLSYKERIQPPVEQWIRSFLVSDMVVTDSFHACVFSIIFNKPFVVIGNADRGLDRFNSLLTPLGLENHLLKSKDEFNVENDYSIPPSVYERIETMRLESLSFIIESLS